MGSSDSLSLPSEPPDIGNWFSSYVYESPELNTIDGFEDSADSIVAETQNSPNESKQNLDGNIIIARTDDLPLDGKGTSDVKSPSRDDNYMSNGLKYSDSLSLGSEPLDIKKWFSSYVYESPVLDTNYEFRSCHVKNDAKCGNKEVLVLSISTRTGKDDSEDENTPPDGLVECKNFVEDTENDNNYIPEDSQKGNGNQNSAELNDLITHRSSDLSFLKKIVQGQGNGSAKDFVISGGSLDKLSSEFNPEVSHSLLNITNGSQENRWKSAQDSIPRWDLSEEIPKAEDSKIGIDISVSPENTEINRVDAKQMRKTCGSVDKENNTEFPENGFISTRKSRSRQVDEEDSLKKPFGIKSDDMKNGIINSPCTSKEVITRRKVLSETTNFQPSNTIEITGKWKCPQKSKPNLGPPLKQLRLEQWIRRI